jgi:hypothetical protein
VTTPSDQPESLFLEEADQLKTIHHQLIGMGQTMIERMIEAGEILTRVKLGLPRHGLWMSWVETHIPELNHRAINRYMLSYKRRDDPLLQEDPARFIAKISGNVGKLKSKSTNTSNLHTKSKAPGDGVPNEAESKEGISSEIPQARRGRAASHEIRPDVANIVNALNSTTPLPEKTVDAPETNKAVGVTSQWLAAISTAQEAIRELERLQEGYQDHIDFGPVKKILAEAERLPVPDAKRI